MRSRKQNDETITLPEFNKKEGVIQDIVYATAKFLTNKYNCSSSYVFDKTNKHKVPTRTIGGTVYIKDVQEVFIKKENKGNLNNLKPANNYLQLSHKIERLIETDKLLYDIIAEQGQRIDRLSDNIVTLFTQIEKLKLLVSLPYKQRIEEIQSWGKQEETAEDLG